MISEIIYEEDYDTLIEVDFSERVDKEKIRKDVEKQISNIN